MKTYTALEVRKQFGRILDEAAAGERIVIERAGQPIAALVPLSDVVEHDPDERKARQLAALAEIRRRAATIRARYGPWETDAATVIRRERDERDAQTIAAVDDARREGNRR